MQLEEIHLRLSEDLPDLNLFPLGTPRLHNVVLSGPGKVGIASPLLKGLLRLRIANVHPTSMSIHAVAAMLGQSPGLEQLQLSFAGTVQDDSQRPLDTRAELTPHITLPRLQRLKLADKASWMVPDLMSQASFPSVSSLSLHTGWSVSTLAALQMHMIPIQTDGGTSSLRFSLHIRSARISISNWCDHDNAFGQPARRYRIRLDLRSDIMVQSLKAIFQLLVENEPVPQMRIWAVGQRR